MIDTLTHKWQEALVQAAALPARFEALPAWALLITTEGSASASNADHESSFDPFGDRNASDLQPVLEKCISPEGAAVALLQRVVARASTLQERRGVDWLVAEPPESDPAVAARLQRWAAHVAPGDDPCEAMVRFRLWEALDAGAAARAVGPVRVREGGGLPAWAETLREALFEANYADPLGACDSQSPLLFEALHLPFVNIFHRRLLAAIPDINALLTPRAQADLARGLLYVLAQMACEALYVEFSRYRIGGFAPLLAFISREPDALYRRFVAAMQEDGLRTFYASYPVLGRIQAVLTDLAVETAAEFLRRLKADLPEICHRWRIAAPVLVAEIADALGDRHRGGRRVMAITFNQGPRLIYKPKILGIDLAYNDLLAWLNRRGAPVALRPLLVLARDGYGWVEFAAPEACRDEDAVERYYRRVGALVCLVYLLQGSDCHAENLIASGEQPILVDCETLLNPWPHAAEARGGRRASITQRLIRDSVLSSALLPGSAADGHDGAGTPCGVCDGRREARERRGRWVGINTDRMTMRPVFDWPWTLKNLPHIGGAPAHAEDHLDAISAGFVATYRFLIAQQPALLDPTGPLAAFRGQFVRFVFRATRLYGAILVFALRPSHLRDGADFSLAFELLARALLTAGDRPASWPILGAERRALTQLDIPFLGAYTDRDALELDGGGRVSGYFVRPSYDAMQEKARNLGEADLAFQLGLLRSAIREDIVRRQPAPPPAALHGRAELT